jgi:hypothetical protein
VHVDCAVADEMRPQVWRTKAGARFVRVLHEGTPVAALAWVPLDALVAKLEALVPSNIFGACNA